MQSVAPVHSIATIIKLFLLYSEVEFHHNFTTAHTNNCSEEKNFEIFTTKIRTINKELNL